MLSYDQSSGCNRRPQKDSDKTKVQWQNTLTLSLSTLSHVYSPLYFPSLSISSSNQTELPQNSKNQTSPIQISL